MDDVVPSLNAFDLDNEIAREIAKRKAPTPDGYICSNR